MAVESAGGYNTAAASFPRRIIYEYWHRPYARSRKPPPVLPSPVHVKRSENDTIFICLQHSHCMACCIACRTAFLSQYFNTDCLDTSLLQSLYLATTSFLRIVKNF